MPSLLLEVESEGWCIQVGILAEVLQFHFVDSKKQAEEQHLAAFRLIQRFTFHRFIGSQKVTPSTKVKTTEATAEGADAPQLKGALNQPWESALCTPKVLVKKTPC